MNKLWLLSFLYFINCYAPEEKIRYYYRGGNKTHFAQTIDFKFEFLNLSNNTSESIYKISHPEIFSDGAESKIKITIGNDQNINSSRLSVLRNSIALDKSYPYILIGLYEKENKEKKIYYAFFQNEENLKNRKKLIEEVNQSYNKFKLFIRKNSK